MKDSPQRSSKLLPLAMAAWAALLGASWWLLTAYDVGGQPIAQQSVPLAWPADSEIQPAVDKANLLLFIHPKCPCTSASLAELERMLTDWVSPAERVQIWTVATTPPDSADSWLETSSLRRALELPGARLVVDPGGRKAARFSAAVSGTVLLYDASGTLVYAGGVTLARGHEGDNRGIDALRSALSGWRESSSPLGTPVFGCPLCLPPPPQAATTL